MEGEELVIAKQIRDVYVELGDVLKTPQRYGLHGRVPQPLITALRSMRVRLRQTMLEMRNPEPEGNLEEELSEDFDDPTAPGKAS